MTPADLQSFRSRMGWGHRECWRAFGVHQRTWYRWYMGETAIPLWAREKVRDILKDKESDLDAGQILTGN